MRKIGLDVGDKTVGIAVSDPLGYTAQGITTLERVGIRKDTGKIIDMIKEYECDTVVIGLPKKLDGYRQPTDGKGSRIQRNAGKQDAQHRYEKYKSRLAGRKTYDRNGRESADRSRRVTS